MADAASEGGNGGNGVLRYRVERLDVRTERLEDWRDVVDQDRTSMRSGLEHLALEVKRNGDEVHGLRRVLIAAMVSFTASALVLSFSVLLATGKIG